MATQFSAARKVSPTRSSRFIVRTAARTWVESVRCFPRCLSRPSVCKRSSKTSSNVNSSLPWTRRVCEIHLRPYGQSRSRSASDQARTSSQYESTNRICCLPIRKPFHELQHRGKSQPPRSLSRLTAPRKQRHKRLVLVHAPQPITDAQACTTLRKRS